MKKCRILSIGIIAISILITIVSVIIICNKHNKKIVYADSIMFDGNIGGIEMYIFNDILVDESLVKISPSNCTEEPIFTIKKFGEEDEVEIKGGKAVFESSGRYTLYCKIKSSKDYYVYDRVTITVSNTTTTDMDLYIKRISSPTISVEDSIDINQIAEIKCPTNSQISIKCGEHLTVNNSILTAVKQGYAHIDISIKYHNIIIYKRLNISILPKVIENDIKLELSIGGQILENNIVEIPNDGYAFVINYKLLNTHEQAIDCVTNSTNVQIVSFDSPMIIIIPVSTGQATLIVTPKEYPNTEFTIIVNIVE